MKKILILVLILVSVSIYSETIKIGYFQLEPFVISEENGDPSGIIVEFWENHVAPKMGVDVEWVGPYAFPRLEALLESGEIDTVFIMIKTPPRMEKFLFPDNPFFFMQPGLTLRKEDPMPQPQSLEDIYGLRLGYVEGANVPPYLINDEIILDRISQAEYQVANFQKLLRKRIDAILDLNMVSYWYVAKKFGYADKIRMIPLPVDPTPMYACFAASAKGRNFLSTYKRAMAAIPENTIYDIISRYAD